MNSSHSRMSLTTGFATVTGGGALGGAPWARAGLNPAQTSRVSANRSARQALVGADARTLDRAMGVASRTTYAAPSHLQGAGHVGAKSADRSLGRILGPADADAPSRSCGTPSR